jgi:hypothetical protein
MIKGSSAMAWVIPADLDRHHGDGSSDDELTVSSEDGNRRRDRDRRGSDGAAGLMTHRGKLPVVTCAHTSNGTCLVGLCEAVLSACR